MEDNELIASFEPKRRGYVLVMAFDKLEDMLIEQERIQALFRKDRDDEGKPLPQVETLWMGESAWGERLMMSDQVKVGALVDSVGALQSIDEARRGWAQTRMQVASLLPTKQGLSEAWHPSNEQIDMLHRWAEQVLEPHPAGNDEWSPRIKTGYAREGFNAFCKDHDRPDLQLHGVPGGKAFSAALQSLFPGIAIARRSGQAAYLHGLRRKEGVNPKYFQRN